MPNNYGNRRFKTPAETYYDTAERISANENLFKEFLQCAGRFYSDYVYTEQVLIFGTDKNAQAYRSYDQWREYNRGVKYHSRYIPLKRGPIFSDSATYQLFSTPQIDPPDQWRGKNSELVRRDALRENYNTDSVLDAARSLANDSWEQQQQRFMTAFGTSAPKDRAVGTEQVPLDTETVKRYYIDAVSACVDFMVKARCGELPENALTENNEGIRLALELYGDTEKKLALFGASVQQISKNILKSYERAIAERGYDDIERNNVYDREARSNNGKIPTDERITVADIAQEIPDGVEDTRNVTGENGRNDSTQSPETDVSERERAGDGNTAAESTEFLGIGNIQSESVTGDSEGNPSGSGVLDEESRPGGPEGQRTAAVQEGNAADSEHGTLERNESGTVHGDTVFVEGGNAGDSQRGNGEENLQDGRTVFREVRRTEGETSDILQSEPVSISGDGEQTLQHTDGTSGELSGLAGQVSGESSEVLRSESRNAEQRPVEVGGSDEQYPDDRRGNTGEGDNLRVSDEEHSAVGNPSAPVIETTGKITPRQKCQDNINAIAVMKRLRENNQQASDIEKEILSKYSGWGGLPQVFDEGQRSWANERQQLKDWLTPDEYEQAKASTLNAHYTSNNIISAMYSAIESMGYADIMFHGENENKYTSLLDIQTLKMIQFNDSNRLFLPEG